MRKQVYHESSDLTKNKIRFLPRKKDISSILKQGSMKYSKSKNSEKNNNLLINTLKKSFQKKHTFWFL